MSKLLYVLFAASLIIGIGFIFSNELSDYVLGTEHTIDRIREITDEVVKHVPEEIERASERMFAPGLIKTSSNNKLSHLSVDGVLGETNKERVSYELATLSLSSVLSEAAEKKVDDMFLNQYFEHESPSGINIEDLMNSVSYDYISIAENLAFGNYNDDKTLVSAWMDSPGHRANILNGDFTEIGISVKRGTFEGKATWIAVQEFGLPRNACPFIDELLKHQFNLNKKELDNIANDLKEIKNELNSMQPKHGQEFNQKVSEYNGLIGDYNSLSNETKFIVDKYNSQVNAFNVCATS